MIKAVNAVRLARAADLAAMGRTSEALKKINKIKHPVNNLAIIESFRAYLQAVSGSKEAAKASVNKARKLNISGTPNGEYILLYCSYVDAMIDQRIPEFNTLCQRLLNYDTYCSAKSILPIIGPYGYQNDARKSSSSQRGEFRGHNTK
jgi:hypothetical protein